MLLESAIRLIFTFTFIQLAGAQICNSSDMHFVLLVANPITWESNHALLVSVQVERQG